MNRRDLGEALYGLSRILDMGLSFDPKRESRLVHEASQILLNETCPRCGVAIQTTHHPLCQAEDGTPTDWSYEVVKAATTFQDVLVTRLGKSQAVDVLAILADAINSE